MITTIIFDIGNVLAEFRWKDYLSDCNFDDITKEVVANATVLNPVWDEFDRGIITLDAMIDFCINCAPDYRKEILQFFEKKEELVKEYEYAVPLILALKSSGYQVYILSNYAESTFQYAKRDFKFFNHVDGQLISYEIKKIKPEPEIYETLFKKYNINPDNTVFLDDKEKNLEGAKVFGLKTILFTSLKSALAELKALGVTIDSSIDETHVI